MRAFFVLAALTIASMPWPSALPLGTPQIAIEGADCAAAQPDARLIAEALGFRQARTTLCGRGAAFATLSGTIAPRMPAVRNLVAYSAPAPRSLGVAGTTTTFKVPGEIPWVSTVRSRL